MAVGDSASVGRAYGARYPSPFFDVGQQYLPATMAELLQWSKYYFLNNPWIHTTVTKLSEYPVTPLIFSEKNKTLQTRYERLARRLKLRQFQVEIGLDFFTYGNCFVSVSYPLVKFLGCKGCKTRLQASKNRTRYTWRDMRFHLKCPKCGMADYAEEYDTYPRNVNGIRLIRWNPEQIRLKHNEVTGRTRYYYRIPNTIRNDVSIGDKDVIEDLPSVYLRAIREQKMLALDEKNFYHLKRPTLAQADQGWGTPLLYPVLKDAFLMQVLRKSQEMVAFDHIVPFRSIAPGPVTGGNEGPVNNYNLANWKAQMEREVLMWRRDHNYIPILPVAATLQQWGGDAKPLLVQNEMKSFAETIVTGIGAPVEFIMGGLSWSGSNTSLRALENFFLGYNLQREELVFDFILNPIGAFMGWAPIEGAFERFRMADDLQRTMFLFQLNQAQKISDRTLLQDIGLDYDEEEQWKQKEMGAQLASTRKQQLATAGIQGEAQVRQSLYAAKAQALQMQAAGGAQPQAPAQPTGEAPQAGADPVDQASDPTQPAGDGAQGPASAAMPTAAAGATDEKQQLAMSVANSLQKYPPAEAAMARNKLKAGNPEVYNLVVQIEQAQKGSQVNPTNAMAAPIPVSGSERSPGRMVG